MKRIQHTMMVSKGLISFVLLISVAQLSYAQSILDLTTVEGKWYIIQTDFPMWLKGKKTSPTFNYTLLNKEKPVLLDRVTFLKNGKEKSIIGFDRPVNKEQTEFIWRGKGLLRLLKSKWKILYFDTENNWVIIFFEKTLFTPKGYDVIARDKNLNQSQLNSIKLKLDELGVSSKLNSL